MPSFNGHKNWNHWNVSLWINNDEGLYRQAKYWVRQSDNKVMAAKAMMLELENVGLLKTPDGAPFSYTTILAAMREM